MRQPGIYKDVPIDVYHKEEGISSTGITKILDCPKRYWYEYLSGQAKEEKTKCLEIGQALHKYVLETDKFSENYYFMEEEVDLRTKAGKETYSEHERLANGRTIIRAKDAFDIKGMVNSISNHSVWGMIDFDMKVEHSVYWNAGFYGTRLRARPDLYTNELIVDLKTTDSIQSFQKSIFQYGYHRQAAMQIDGLKAIDGRDRDFYLLVVEKKDPYLVGLFKLSLSAIERGREEYLEGADIYSECLRFDAWPGYEENAVLVKLPDWMEKRE